MAEMASHSDLFGVPVIAARSARKKKPVQLKHPGGALGRKLENVPLKSPVSRSFTAHDEYGLVHVFHNPTYCYLSFRDIEGNVRPHGRHRLNAFAEKNEVQSKNSINKMKNAISWMLMFADKKSVYSKQPYIDKKGVERHIFYFRLSFVTLTIPTEQKHTDKYIKEHMLQPFLYWMSRYFKASYVWKAESQLNGNIHFHITIDTFIHWRSVRAKWNSILAKHGYCKVFQDGSNDKGDAATQIKAIRNENDLAKTIGGYLTRGSIEEKNHYAIKRKKFSMEEIIKMYPFITCNVETRKHYSRFVEGRLWGCSESLSKIRVFTDEIEDRDAFKAAERDFFHDNQVQKLSSLLVEKQKRAARHLDKVQKEFLRKTDEDIARRNEPFEYVYIHRHLKFCKLPPVLAQKIAVEKERRKFATIRNFTVESLL